MASPQGFEGGTPKPTPVDQIHLDAAMDHVAALGVTEDIDIEGGTKNTIRWHP
jgi:hypothetical protein